MTTCLVQLRDGDTLATLAREYGIAAQDITTLNGVPWNKNAIDDWVMGNGGRRAAFSASDPYDAARQLGWALFTSSSQIQLPADGPRPCVTAEATPAASSSSSSIWWWGGGLGLAGLLWAIGSKKKGGRP